MHKSFKLRWHGHSSFDIKINKFKLLLDSFFSDKPKEFVDIKDLQPHPSSSLMVMEIILEMLLPSLNGR